MFSAQKNNVEIFFQRAMRFWKEIDRVLSKELKKN